MKWFAARLAALALLGSSLHVANSQSSESADGPLEQRWRVDLTKPPLYLGFVRRGEPPPQSRGEAGPEIWLQLHNNTKWRVGVWTYGVYDSKGKRTTMRLCPHGAVGVSDGAEIEPIVQSVEFKNGCVQGECYEHLAFGALEWLRPGGSALFSVPASALSRPTQEIRVRVEYEWEMSCNERGVAESVSPRLTTAVVFKANQIPESWSSDAGMTGTRTQPW